MTNDRWNYGQVCSYLAPNYPCENMMSAGWLVASKIEDGTFSTWYREEDSKDYIPIEQHEWRRDGAGHLELEVLGLAPHNVEYESAEVQRLCVPKPGKGGRPTKYDYEGGLIHLANRIFTDAAFSNPSEEDLFQAMRKWMTENNPDGGPTDNRDIRKRVARFYREVIGDG